MVEPDKNHGAIEQALSQIQELSKSEPSRELSLVITKLQEALMWYNAHGLELYLRTKQNSNLEDDPDLVTLERN